MCLPVGQKPIDSVPPGRRITRRFYDADAALDVDIALVVDVALVVDIALDVDTALEVYVALAVGVVSRGRLYVAAVHYIIPFDSMSKR